MLLSLRRELLGADGCATHSLRRPPLPFLLNYGKDSSGNYTRGRYPRYVFLVRSYLPALDYFVGDEPCAKIWSVYISEAEKYDKALVDSWRGNMNGMLIFVRPTPHAGLFSAILTAFIIESYKTLQTSDPLLDTMLHLSQQYANATGTIPAPDPLQVVAFSSLICNVLWFISLGLSLGSALTATFVEQWARDFLQRTEMLPSPVKRARIFAYLYYGLKRFKMHAVVALIPFLLHMSLLFFFGGLFAFLWPVNHAVAAVAAVILAILIFIYALMTVLPLLQFDCPYQTPLSTVFWDLQRYFLQFIQEKKHQPAVDSPRLHTMVDTMIKEATVRDDSGHREDRDRRALAWTMKSLADDDELEPFVEGIPDSIWGPQGTHFPAILARFKHLRFIFKDDATNTTTLFVTFSPTPKFSLDRASSTSC
ncbi:hypothetical protein B0H17DRAFT_958084 [Mycena rosella]|uniref:DUF6535 domain-containing protein n=1 Tax=Mycena rosella TaxID=1033263 RepID=A0AAD7CLH9_MYCRO|nr:hypothetical protein B0H17DRAFT_958084 [Mycena rosella]